MNKLTRIIPVIILAMLYSISGCQAGRQQDLTVHPFMLADGRVLDSLRDSLRDSLQNNNANTDLLDSMIEGINNGEFTGIHSVLIVRGGALVLEEYFHGQGPNTRHEIRSATKSIGSILTGIAIDKGYIESEENSIYQYLKENHRPSPGWNEEAREIKISHLLSMLSGYDCDDLNTDYACEGAMYRTRDWIQYALDLPIIHDPGQHWAYNSSSLILISKIIEITSGMDLDDFSKKYLFDPLGVKSFQWERSPNGLEWIGGGARMTSRDMARIGLLMLRGGEWENTSIVSEDWIGRSTSRHSEMPGSGVDYCFLWQRGETITGAQLVSAYWASGNGGQYIIVIPQLDMVVVFTGGNYDSELANQPFSMLTGYILPAFLEDKAKQPFSPDPEFLESLTGTYALDIEPAVTAKIEIYENGIRIRTPDMQYVDLDAITDSIFSGVSPTYGPLGVRFIIDDSDEISGLITYGGFSRYTFDKRKSRVE
jgi:CubicO group peptidase (beta-lactamase class C family)